MPPTHDPPPVNRPIACQNRMRTLRDGKALGSPSTLDSATLNIGIGTECFWVDVCRIRILPQIQAVNKGNNTAVPIISRCKLSGPPQIGSESRSRYNSHGKHPLIATFTTNGFRTKPVQRNLRVCRGHRQSTIVSSDVLGLIEVELSIGDSLVWQRGVAPVHRDAFHHGSLIYPFKKTSRTAASLLDRGQVA